MNKQTKLIIEKCVAMRKAWAVANANSPEKAIASITEKLNAEDFVKAVDTEVVATKGKSFEVTVTRKGNGFTVTAENGKKFCIFPNKGGMPAAVWKP